MRSSLRARLRFGLGAVAVAVALLCVAGVVSISQLGNAISTILRENYASVVLCEQMKDALERQDDGALYAATGQLEVARPMLADARERFTRALAREAENITVPGEGELVRDIQARYAAYVSAVDAALSLPKDTQQAAYFRELLPAAAALRGRVDAVLKLNQENMLEADRAAKARARGTAQTAVLVSIASVALAAWFALRLSRSIASPVEALTRSARAIGEGDLDVTTAKADIEELAELGVAFDRMAERLRAYRASSLGELLAAKDLAQTTLEGLLDPVVVVDASRAILLANDAAERAFDLSFGLPAELAPACKAAMSSGAPVLPKSLSDAVAKRVDQEERHYLVRALPLRAAGPREAARALIVAQDVTRLRRIDDLKTDMVATVSHQFKTPLTSLRMATHLLLEATTGALTENQTELVTTARDETERLRSMVEELLDVVRIEAEAGALRKTAVDPRSLFADVLDAHRAVARDKGVELEVDAATTDARVEVDPERISIALANLVSNAVRHTPPGGRVRLSAKASPTSIALVVDDTGEGIAPADLPNIFAWSATGKGADPASQHGLGLAIAREIVLQHGGELCVKSELGRGSAFEISLPRAG